MQLIGMLDSPFVRRTAVSLHLLGLLFTHRSLSVFRTFDAFHALNPVVKAPTLVCDDGTVLMDSTLIIEHAEWLAAPRRSLMPADGAARLRALRVLGLALAAAEKSVQIVYEHGVRPADKQHGPWLDRVTQQLHAAFAALEAECARAPLAQGEAIDQAGLTTAVVWDFTQRKHPGLVAPEAHPRLAAHSAQAEALPAFRAWPFDDTTLHLDAP